MIVPGRHFLGLEGNRSGRLGNRTELVQVDVGEARGEEGSSPGTSLKVFNQMSLPDLHQHPCFSDFDLLWSSIHLCDAQYELRHFLWRQVGSFRFHPQA